MRRWQKLRAADVAREKELKEEALLKLEARERDNRKRIEDLLTPQSTPAAFSLTAGDENGTSARTNGKVRANGQTTKRGKKRKAD